MTACPTASVSDSMETQYIETEEAVLVQRKLRERVPRRIESRSRLLNFRRVANHEVVPEWIDPG